MKFDLIKSVLRNSAYLHFPLLSRGKTLPTSTVMSGVLPGTQQWRKYYPETLDVPDELLWRLFRRRHDIAQERADHFRQLAKAEAPVIESVHGSLPISLRRPDVLMVGCVGASMTGAGIRYMDLLVIMPVRRMPTVNPGPVTRRKNGVAEHDNFIVNIDENSSLSAGNIALLNYNPPIMNEARKTCPSDLLDWLDTLQKIRKVDTLKVKEDGKQFLGVSTNRGVPESGFDHPIENIYGRAFAHYSCEHYEPRLKNSGIWNRLSLAARYPYFISPRTVWSNEFSDLSRQERQIVEAALLNEDDNSAAAENILNELESTHKRELNSTKEIAS